jgi:hypothetical protein
MAHWERFIELAPESPWAEEARLHLAERRNPEAVEETGRPIR